MTLQMPKLYKRDTNGSIRVWWMEVNGDTYRTVSGVLGGAMVESDWTLAKGKNTGKANETTGEQQALLEAQSKHEKKSGAGRYFDSVDKVDEKTYFKPMLAEKWNDEKDKQVGIKAVTKAFAAGIRVFVQPKLDGYRCIDENDAMYTRNGETYFTCPHVHAMTSPFHLMNFGGKLDGELYNHDLHDNFNSLQSLVSPNKTEPTIEELEETKAKVKYYIYDMYSEENPAADFVTRQQYLDLLEKTGFFNNDFLIRVPTVEVFGLDDIDRMNGEYLAENYEGMMIRINAPYETKRTKNLIKRKEFFDEEFEIIGSEEGEGNWAGKLKVLQFKTADGKYFKATIKGGMEKGRELLAVKDTLPGRDATVRYPNKTPDGIPRFGVVTTIWDGKRNA